MDRLQLGKKPMALPPWAESTNEGGGGDNRSDRIRTGIRWPARDRLKISVGAFLLHCNIGA
jgi:hypothetical protein